MSTMEKVAVGWFTFWMGLLILALAYAVVKAIAQSSEWWFWTGAIVWLCITFGLLIETEEY